MMKKMANTTKTLQISLMILCVALLGGFVAYFFDLGALLSFEVGFLGFLSVVGGSFLGVLKRVKAQGQDSLDSSGDFGDSYKDSNDANDVESKDSKNQAKQENSSFSARFVLGTQMSFSLLRMLSYIVFTGLILLLLHYRFFSLIWFFVGLCVSLIVLVGLGMFMVKAYKDTKM